jgi:hypothetical protein
VLGRSHVACAALAGALGAAAIGLPPAATLAFTLTCAGAGAGPDWDEPGSNVSRTWPLAGPLVGHVLAAGSEAACGQGHRGVTHWPASTAVALGLAVTLTGTLWPAWTAAGCLLLPGAWALRCSLPYRVHRALWAPLAMLAAAVAVAMPGSPVPWLGGPWLGLAVFLGWALHPLCDVATTDRHPGGDPTKGPGVALLAPFSMRKHGWSLLAFAGPGEQAVAWLALAGANLITALRVAHALGL